MDNKNTNNQTSKKKQKKQKKQTKQNFDDFKEEIKKQGSEIGDTILKFVKKTTMLLLILFFIICIILYFYISGGISLYLSKLGDTSILPTDKEFYPYTNVRQSITPSSANIFTNSTISFPYDAYNSSNYLLNGTRKYKETLQSSFYLSYLIMNYFITIYENMVQFNYAAINLGLYVMHQIPSDTATLLFGPTILTIITFIIGIINPIYFIFTWFASLTTFFEFEKNAEQLETTADFKGIWKSLNLILHMGLVPISIITALFLAWIMFLMFFFSTWWTFSVVAIILWLVLLSCYFYAATINGVHVTMFSTILGILKFYKFSIMTLISLIILLLSFFNLGIMGVITCLVILFLTYLGVFTGFGLDMFD